MRILNTLIYKRQATLGLLGSMMRLYSMTLPRTIEDREYKKFVEIDSETAVRVSLADGFNIEKFDDIVITYVASGNGEGEIETVTYKLDGSDIATLTLTYNADNKLIEIARS